MCAHTTASFTSTHPLTHSPCVRCAVVLVLCGGLIFFRMEQNAVKKSRLDDQHVREHNELLKSKNDELKEAKAQLIKDEEE